jgi:hypothetical protein
VAEVSSEDPSGQFLAVSSNLKFSFNSDNGKSLLNINTSALSRVTAAYVTRNIKGGALH